MPSSDLPVRLRIGDLDECEVGTVTIDDATTQADMADGIGRLLEATAAQVRAWPAMIREAHVHTTEDLQAVADLSSASQVMHWMVDPAPRG